MIAIVVVVSAVKPGVRAEAAMIMIIKATTKEEVKSKEIDTTLVTIHQKDIRKKSINAIISMKAPKVHHMYHYPHLNHQGASAEGTIQKRNIVKRRRKNTKRRRIKSTSRRKRATAMIV